MLDMLLPYYLVGPFDTAEINYFEDQILSFFLMGVGDGSFLKCAMLLKEGICLLQIFYLEKGVEINKIK